MRSLYLAAFLLLAWSFAASAQNDPLADAVAALQRGDLAAAERTLRAEVAAHPNNADALGVLAVVFDQEKKYDEADPLYKRAIHLEPRSPALLNNYGNHLMAGGKLIEARPVFLKVLALNPSQPNALLQSARIALHQKSAAEALRYLERLQPDARQNPEVDVTRMQALYRLHRASEANQILSRLDDASRSDARLSYSVGTALAAAGRYEDAERVLSRAVELAPDNSDFLYSLGLAASHAGHDARARDVLESVHRREPRNVDVMYDLAAVQAGMGRREEAVQLLADAARLAPNRADVQQLLARTTADLGYFADAIEAWDRYLKLVPGDAVARRERAFDATANGGNIERGLVELKAYAVAHPRDAVGLYELAVAEAASEPDDALRNLDRALVLKPDLAAAHIARGLVYFKQGEFDRARPDFESALQRESQNPVVLDHLGQTYMALDRAAEALPLLRKAVELAPRDSKTLLHLARALTNAGQQQEAAAVFARFRELGPDRSALPREAGLLDFLSLPKQEQVARYRAGVERTVQKDPSNAEAQVRYLKLLLEDGKTAEAAGTAQHLATLKPSPALLNDASSALLAAGLYAAARDLLNKTLDPQPAPDLLLNLALATFHSSTPEAGLAQLDRIPPPRRWGDYFMARAEMLDAAGHSAEAVTALNQGLHAHPTRIDLYRYAVSFLVQHARIADALDLLDRGTRAFPDVPDLLLMRAVVLQAEGKKPEAGKVLVEIENRWPDWYKVWVAHAILAKSEGNEKQASEMAATAGALGGGNAQERLERSGRPGANLMETLFP